MKKLGKKTVAILLVALVLLLQLGDLTRKLDARAKQLIFSDPPAITTSYYVGSSGDDSSGDGSFGNPWASLAKAADVINGLPGADGKHYEIIVLDNIEATRMARFYGRSITIKSGTGGPFTVSRGLGFAVASDTVRPGGYNPALIEIGNAVPGSIEIYLTVENIIFDDLGHSEATGMSYGGNTATVQDAIIASYDPATTIVLKAGASLRNYGGMSAVRVMDNATLIMQSGSLITDTMTPAQLSKRGTTGTSGTGIGYGNFFASGDSAVSVLNANFDMQAGARITAIFNNNGVGCYGSSRLRINGEISGLRGFAAFDPAYNTDGRGSKNAVYISGPTLDWDSGNPGAAIIGPDAQIINNQIKSGAVYIIGSNATLKIYGKINNNTALAGVVSQGSIVLNAGTNGGGLYIQGGATVYLEEPGEIRNNTVSDFAYGGGVSIQQGSPATPSTLIMNGGTIANNTAPNGRDIAVNKQSATFIMNGGVISNSTATADARNTVVLIGDRNLQTNGDIILNGGTISSVSLNLRDTPAVTVFTFTAVGSGPASTPNTFYGNINERHIYANKDIVIGNGGIIMKSLTGKATVTYSALLGMNYLTNDCRDYLITPKVRDFKMGFANWAIYPDVRAALPTDWHLPSDDAYVVAMWIYKNGVMEFEMPAPPTAAASTGYLNTTNVFFAAVVPVDATGARISGAAVRFFPVKRSGTTLAFELPLNLYPNGAAVVLCQGTDKFGVLEFTAPSVLPFDITKTTYAIAYTGEYSIPDGFIAELITSGDDATTTVKLYIQPDSRVDVSGLDLSINSAIFEVVGSPVWNSVTHELEVDLRFKIPLSDISTVSPVSTFSFSGTLAASDFSAGDFLSLTGFMNITGNNSGNIYYIGGNITRTAMVAEEGIVIVSNTTTGTEGDPNKAFNFKIEFSDAGTYDGITSGYTFTLKHGESLTINGIANGVVCTVTQTDANTGGYVTTISGGTTRAIEPGNTLLFAFTNTRNRDVNTGDRDNTIIYICLAVGAVGIVVALFGAKRKKK